MGNLYSKALLTIESVRMYLQFAVVFAVLLGYVGALAPAAQGLTANVIAPICSVYLTVHTVVFVLGLTLLILGAALYAGGNIAPGNLKGSIQGYGMGMIVGGIVGVMLAIIAPWLLGVISGNTTIATTCT
jgi:hypothetical protein